VVLCSFHSAPSTQAKFVCRRLRRHWPSLHITLAAWAGTQEALGTESLQTLGIDALAATLPEVTAQLTALVTTTPRPILVGDSVLSASTPPDVGIRELLARTAQRAADVFRVPLASVVWKGGPTAWWLENAGKATWTQPDGWQPTDSNSPLAAVLMRNEILVIADTARVPEFAPSLQFVGAESDANLPHDRDSAQASTHPSDRFEGLIAFAGVPVRDKQGHLWGVLALHDASVRAFTSDELALLASMGDELRVEIEHQLAVSSFAAEGSPRLAPGETAWAPHSDPAASMPKPMPMPTAA
jgi:GAF domain-containing protein